MYEIFRKYFLFTLHPFKQHTLLAAARHQTIPTTTARTAINPLSTSIAVSWIYVVISALYTCLTIMFGKIILTSASEVFGHLLPILEKSKMDKNLILFTMFKITIFPFLIYLMVLFWRFIIPFSCKIFNSGQEELNGKIVDEIIISTLSSYAYLTIPFFGGFIQNISSLVILYAGLNRNLKLTSLQSVTVLIMPILLSFCFITLMGTLIYLLTF